MPGVVTTNERHNFVERTVDRIHPWACQNDLHEVEQEKFRILLTHDAYDRVACSSGP